MKISKITFLVMAIILIFAMVVSGGLNSGGYDQQHGAGTGTGIVTDIAYATDNTSLAAAIASSASIIEVGTSPITLTGNLPVTKALRIDPDAAITTGAYTLTINESFSAGLYQVFVDVY